MISCAGTTNSRRGRPPDDRLIKLDRHLIALVKHYQPITVRGTFYRAEVLGLVPKSESYVRLIGRRLLKLRRGGFIPYAWISDENMSVYCSDSYGGLSELADDAAALYRRDYWRDSPDWVQVFIEKRALAGVLTPIVVRKWGLNLYACGGQPSETMIYRAGQDIAVRGLPTAAYVLSDFDPAGGTIFDALSIGTKDAPGGLSRFTNGIPVFVERLALNEDQVKTWDLPTRPAKKTDRRAAKFIERYGDTSTELDAIPPDALRDLVDQAIGQHMDQNWLERLKLIEASEQEIARAALLACQDTNAPVPSKRRKEPKPERPADSRRQKKR
jgi:hypothetical protein